MQKKRSSCWDSRTGGARLALALAAASALAHVGCNASCDLSPDSNPAQVYTAGTANGTVYESTPTTGAPLPFPGGKQYLFVHHLGFTPTYPMVYVGFDASGNDLSPCAGNTCIVPCVNSEVIWLKNDTCADFLVRVVTTGRSSDQQGTLCPGGASLSAPGAPDASVEASVTTPDSSEAESAVMLPDNSEASTTDATDAAQAE